MAVSAFSAESQPATLALGDQAPPFGLPAVTGGTVSLEDFQSAKILVVVFTCNHCPTAQLYEPRLKQLVADYTNRAVAFVAISPNDPASVRLDELGWSDLGDSFEEMKLRARERDVQFSIPV